MSVVVISRTAMTDDDGSGTTGTIFNNAWKTALYNDIDGLFTQFGDHTFTAGATGSNKVRIVNTTSGTGNYAGFEGEAGTNGLGLYCFSQGYTASGRYKAAGIAFEGTGAGGVSIGATNAAGEIRFYTNGTNLRWTIDSGGDLRFGPSQHICDSISVPTISGFVGGASPTIAGVDYAHVVTNGGGNTSITVAFGESYSTTPIVVPSSNDSAITIGVTAVSTSAYTMANAGGLPGTMCVLVRSY